MSQQWPGGYIVKSPPAVVGPTGSPPEGGSAPGIWTLDQARAYEKLGQWPKPVIERQLWAWGANTQGQLGLNNTTNYSSPKQIGALTNWLQIACGYLYTVSTKNDGTLWAWGNNQYGQLGDNTAVSRSSPIQIGALTTWSQVAGGKLHTISIKTDGTLWAWGRNNYGQLGIGNTTDYSSPKQVGALTTWLKISCGSYHTAAIKTDGTLWTWGANNSYGQLGLNNLTNYSSPKQVGALTTWSQVVCGRDHTVAIKTDGSLWAWGLNQFVGQLGLNNTTNYSSPKQVGALTTWYNVACGSQFTISTKTDGTLWAWGGNSFGELGLGNTTSYSSPKQVGALTTWLQIAGAYSHSVATKTDGTLWSWGRNNSGQLGIGNTTNQSSPVQVGALTTWLRLPKMPMANNFTVVIKQP